MRRIVDGQIAKRGEDTDPGGRPSSVNSEAVEKALEVIRRGLPVDKAFILHGVSQSTLRYWVLQAHKDPTSQYGDLLTKIMKAIAEMEAFDLTVLQMHIQGRAAEYQMEPARNKNGEIDRDENGKPIMQVARNSNGDAILRRKEIQSDWRAAVQRLALRFPRTWGRGADLDIDSPITTDGKKEEPKDVMSFDDRVKIAMTKAEEEF